MVTNYSHVKIKILILGIGNSILRDDGIGPAIIQELKQCCARSDVSLKTTNLTGMPLLDLLIGYDVLMVADAIKSGAKPGEIQWLQVDDFKIRTHACSQHNMNILQVLELGKHLGLDVPSDIQIIAVEAYDVTNFGEDLTPAVAKAIPKAAASILQKVNSYKKENQPPVLHHPLSTGQAN